MDPRLYTYEYRRPRLSNPTYISQNVNNSLTYYLNNPMGAYPPQRIQHSNTDHQEPPHDTEPMSKNRSAYLENGGKQRYEQVAQQHEQPYGRQSSVPKMPSQNQDVRLKGKGLDQVAAHSNLSNYGSNVLRGSLYSDQEVYKKQEKKFNIITLKPNAYDQTIKQYPKLTLEDKDAYFYKKMQQEQLFNQQYRQQQEHRQKQMAEHQQTPQQTQQHPYKNDKSAGKPTYSSSPAHQPNRLVPNAKVLTNLDELGHI